MDDQWQIKGMIIKFKEAEIKIIFASAICDML
jgi:hypothetical protein